MHLNVNYLENLWKIKDYSTSLFQSFLCNTIFYQQIILSVPFVSSTLDLFTITKKKIHDHATRKYYQNINSLSNDYTYVVYYICKIPQKKKKNTGEIYNVLFLLTCVR